MPVLTAHFSRQTIAGENMDVRMKACIKDDAFQLKKHARYSRLPDNNIQTLASS